MAARKTLPTWKIITTKVYSAVGSALLIIKLILYLPVQNILTTTSLCCAQDISMKEKTRVEEDILLRE